MIPALWQWFVLWRAKQFREGMKQAAIHHQAYTEGFRAGYRYGQAEMTECLKGQIRPLEPEVGPLDA
jgi:hypothetical protein